LHARDCSDKYVCIDPEYDQSVIPLLDELIADMNYGHILIHKTLTLTSNRGAEKGDVYITVPAKISD